ncbi:MAG: insulinase family protein [Cyclobacteriaceae bacterium]|nr:insulinase family protein [Cyclobacteriaceae bacterium]
MRAILTLCFILGLLGNTIAQVDRSKAPLPGPEHAIKIGEYQSFTLKNGLQVFVVENHKLPRLQFSIQLKHDPIFEGDKAGYVSMAGDIIGTGTTHRTKAKLDEEVDFIGASLNTSAYSLYASSLSKHTEKLLELMTDVLYNPSFEQSELDKLKTQTISGIAAGKDDPSTIASNVQGFLLYGKDHPYGEVATEKTVASISIEDCRNYYQTYFKPNNAYLVMVGDITLKEAKKIANKNFSKWVGGEVKNKTYPVPHAPEKTFVALVDRPASVQSIINIAYPINLKVGSEDVIKARVMNQILGGSFSARLNQNLREKHAYTYGSNSQLSSDDLVGKFNASASVRNEVTDSAVYEIMHELNRIVKDPVSAEELMAAKASIAGSFGRSLERPQTIAGFAVNTAKYNLPKDYYSTYLKRLDAVSIEQVQTAAKKYITPDHAYIEVVGKGAEIAKSLEQFGDVKYYDIHGEEYKPEPAKALPDGLTAQKVIDQYIQGIGGAKRAKEIKTLKMVYKAQAMGTELTMTMIKSAPNKGVVDISANGMILQKVVSTGKEASIASMGQSVPMDAETKEKTLFESAIFPELSLEGVATNLISVEKVDGKDAYAVEYAFKSGAKSTYYYDVETGLKVKQTESMETPQGTIVSSTTYTDYKEVDGIRFPQKVSQQQGPMSFNFELIDLQVNPQVKDSLFSVK